MNQPPIRNRNIIEATDQHDEDFILRQEGHDLSGIRLPTGARVPTARENTAWIATEGLLALKINPKLDSVEGFRKILPDTLVPVSEADADYLEQKENFEQPFSGKQLPSGARVPEAIPGCEWIAIGEMLKLISVGHE